MNAPKVDFSGSAHASAVRAMRIRQLNVYADKRNAEFVEALRREGKTLRELMAERLDELQDAASHPCATYDAPWTEINNLIEAVEEFLNDNK